MLFVQHNLLAENASRQLNASGRKNAKTTEKLSSGFRINRAADDAAGLSISEKMRRQVRGLHQTVDNITEGVGYVQTAEGALNEVHDMLQRMNELSVKAANGTNTEEDRAYIDSEVQALKDELDRIFGTTTFNEQKIWEAKEKKLLGYDTVSAVSSKGPINTMTVTNKNYAVLPGGYHYSSSSYRGVFDISADVQDGVSISWTGYNGVKYETDKIGWDKLEEQNYTFEMSTLFDQAKYPELFDGADPVFKHTVAFAPAETATIEDIVDCIDGQTMVSYASVNMRGTWENTTGNNKNFQIVNEILLYPSAYASQMNAGAAGGHDFDAADDMFLEPAKTGNTNLTKYPQYSDVPAAVTDSSGWEFSFNMTGIGSVKASSTSISYWSNDQTEDHEGVWWNWYTWYDSSGKQHREKRQIVHSAAGTLAGAMSTLTGDEHDGTPGLFNKDGNGCNAGSSGTLQIHFSLNADSSFQYTGSNGAAENSTAVGSFSLQVPISANESEDEILEKIKAALNDNSVLDFATTGAGADSASMYPVYPVYKGIKAPVYGGTCGFYVQAGTEGGQHISVQYEALSVMALGLQDTNTLTQESSRNAINEIKGALRMVSEQRSTFGAYQNRIEHASNINANVEENTQAAESRIRDADIADLMMEYSINNIIMQAGTSMLTQANQSSQSILELLQ